jgi:hypothetical protein
VKAGARLYVTEIWCPPADDGVHALSSHMLEPEPLPEPEPEADMTTLKPRIEAAFFAAAPEPEPEAAEPEAERLTDTAADLGHDYAEYQAWAAEPEPEAEL